MITINDLIFWGCGAFIGVCIVSSLLAYIGFRGYEKEIFDLYKRIQDAQQLPVTTMEDKIAVIKTMEDISLSLANIVEKSLKSARRRL